MDKSTGNKISRRRSLTLIGTGAASLIGTSLLTRYGWAGTPVLAASNTVKIRTHEHFGDIDGGQ